MLCSAAHGVARSTAALQFKKALGHPIVGDWLYGTGDANRLCLHASRLAFDDPALQGERVCVASAASWELSEPPELVYVS